MSSASDKMPVSEQDLREAALHTKMGRNLLLFQRIEYVLKAIADLGRVACFHPDESMTLEPSQVGKKTLGLVVKRLNDDQRDERPILDRPVLHSFPPAQVCSWKLGFKIDPFDDLSSKLTQLVLDRNQFIHHFVERYPWATEKGLADALAELDQHYQTYTLLLATLTNYHRMALEGFEHILHFFQTPEGEKVFEEMLRPQRS